MRVAGSLLLFMVVAVADAEAGQWAPVSRTEQWSAPTKTEQWGAPAKTEQWAPAVKTEVRDPDSAGQQVTPQSIGEESGIDGKKLVWVNWNGQPYQAWILKSEGKRHYVAYKDWPSNYNEWISSASVITEAQAKRMLARQKKRDGTSGSSASGKAYQQMDRSRELSNSLHQETQQQYRDTERYYEERRYR